MVMKEILKCEVYLVVLERMRGSVLWIVVEGEYILKMGKFIDFVLGEFLGRGEKWRSKLFIMWKLSLSCFIVWGILVGIELFF